jgi:hypothetical protein
LADRAQQIKDNEAKTAGYEADKKHAVRSGQAQLAAQNGFYKSEDFSDLPKEEQAFYEKWNSAGQKPVEQQFKSAGNLADQGNLYAGLQADIKGVASNPVQADRSWWNPMRWGHPAGVPADNIIQPSDHALAVRNQLAQAMPQVLAQGEKYGDISRNPVTSGYVNAAPVPANIRYVPQLPPPGGGTNSVPLTPGMGAPTNAVPVVPMTAPQQAVGGYIVGKVYGGLRYMGGNPNDEASWQRFRGREPVE